MTFKGAKRKGAKVQNAKRKDAKGVKAQGVRGKVGKERIRSGTLAEQEGQGGGDEGQGPEAVGEGGGDRSGRYPKSPNQCNMHQMGFPGFYDRQRVGALYRPRIADVITAASGAGRKAAQEDHRRILLLLVDPQVDFVHADGSLSVPGAVDDTRRVIEWLFTNLEQVTDIVVSLDSHLPLHIFYPGWWVDRMGRHPEPMSAITAREVDEFDWQPLFEEEWSRYYVHELEKRARKVLLIWPYHTMIGTVGHSITPALYEALTYHSEARRSQLTYLVKGRIPKTEHYSVFEPEVKVPGEPEGDLNAGLLGRMATYDLIYVAGQAKSHCVLETVVSMANYAEGQPGLIGKVRLLADCMSSVVHPELDFEALANEKFAALAGQGLLQVSSADPIE